MMHAALLLLALLATDVSRARTLTVPRSIDRTVLRLAVGLAATYGNEANLPSVVQLMEGDLGDVRIGRPLLFLNGRRDGLAIVRIARAATTLARFALDRSGEAEAVELRYEAAYRGLAIARQVTVTESQIVSRASFPCRLGPQGRCRHVWLAVVADETKTGTTIRLAATVRVNTGLCPARGQSRCKLVNRVAAHAIRKQLDGMLRQAEQEGRAVSATGRDAIVSITRGFLNRITRWTR